MRFKFRTAFSKEAGLESDNMVVASALINPPAQRDHFET